MATYNMNSTDFVNSLMIYMWSKFVPSFRARGLPFRHVLDVSDTIANTGQTVKVTVAQVQTANNLADGGTKVLNDTPPLVANVTLTDDFYVSFGITDLVKSFINGQPTLPAVVNGALHGLLNTIEQQIITDLIANVPAANVVGTYGTNITTTNFIQAQNILTANYAPRADYMAFLAPTAGAWGQLVQIPNVVYAQERGWPSTQTGALSPLTLPGGEYGQQVQWNGGLWSQSQLCPSPTVSGAVQSGNPVWMKEALAVAMRVPEAPIPGSGAIANNFVDAESGIAMQMLWTYNKDTLANEMVLRTIFGDASAQPAWSALIKGA